METLNYLPLLSDVFSAFFQNKARLKQNPPRETEENREIMETALGLKEYEELHTVSRLDFFASAAATRAFSDQIIKLIKERRTKRIPRKAKRATALSVSIPILSAGPSEDRSRRDWRRLKKQSRRSRSTESRFSAMPRKLVLSAGCYVNRRPTRGPKDSARHLPQTWGMRLLNNLVLGWIKGDLFYLRISSTRGERLVP